MGWRKSVALGLWVIVCAVVQISHALDLNHRLWDQVLKKNVHQGLVDYQTLKANPRSFEAYLKELESVRPSDYEAWSRRDKIAFWLNAYNALTIKAILDHYPIKPSWLGLALYPKNSIRQIPGVWDKLTWRAAGRVVTLNDIEHKILRAEFREPRLHMALVCASIGCPALREEAFTGKKLESQLEEQTRSFLASSARFRIDRESRRVYLSPIFQWFGQDFIEKDTPSEGLAASLAAEKASLNFISRYLKDEDSRWLAAGKYHVKYLDYDWSLNERSLP